MQQPGMVIESAAFSSMAETFPLNSALVSTALGRRGRRWRGWATVALVLLAPVLVVVTVASMAVATPVAWLPSFRLILLIDLAYVLVIAAVVLVRIARLIAARRSRSAGSQLHLRLSSVFGGVALVPAITVAAFPAITINIGLEGWFSDRVQAVVGNSVAAAQAYQAEQENTLREDGQAIADLLAAARRANPLIQEGEIRVLLSQAQAGIQRGKRSRALRNKIRGSGKENIELSQALVK